ncbi:MAG: CinA family nicotinamide mononucleotide deamidase-related protein [Proteobacteria bacterium]|nr:CinA family nicotinamide mononucleotide deamidase-related protein [Desulfobulbaceae bacterium]MBU4152309.1 CinA family nicotinamide mononucleotide deamidase-related protein [Pseudomonadota bacterium]MDP2107139.1 CinA family nicotinamide mononucleotide deamidase-related protein [Desulfobulbaceae bacterium]
MRGEIIAIGDELTSGRILNMTSHFAAHHLFAVGHEIVAMATIGDSPELIGSALTKALDRADFVIVTGGLGPTSDDLTNEAVASALNRPATLHPEILVKIEAYLVDSKATGDLRSRGVSLEKLAWLPAGAEVLKPEASMAGYFLVHAGKPIFFLPGVPHEMKELLTDSVIPRLAAWQQEERRFVRQLLYRIFGMPESEVNHRVSHLEAHNSMIRLGYYPVFPEVHLNLTAIGTSEEETDSLFVLVDQMIREAIGSSLYGTGEDTMATAVGLLLREHGLTLALAESCTGGLISHLVTTVPGSSGYYLGGVCAYSNAMKIKFLAVDPELLARHGAVSGEVAEAMVRGVCQATGADLGVSVTGIAGPDGGRAEKPVGTVFFGIAWKGAVSHCRRIFSGKREEIQCLSAQTGLDLIRRKLLEEKYSLE